MMRRGLFAAIGVFLSAGLIVSALAQIPMTGAGKGGSGGGVVPATQWNPADRSSAFLAVSNVGRTVTYTNTGNTGEGIRSVDPSKTNQKVYMEHVIGTVVTNWQIGFAVIGASLAVGSNLGNATPTLGAGLNTTNGNFSDFDASGGSVTSIAPLTTVDRLGVAFNTSTMKIWFRKNGGGWNTVPGGAQDPAAGTGGLTVVLTGSPYYALVGLDANTGDHWTTNFASTDWVDVAPSGYTQLAP